MQEQSATANMENEPVFPDQVINSIQLVQPLDKVLIKGRVNRLSKPYPVNDPKWVYGDLFGQDSIIGFRCPVDKSPKAEGEYIIFSGYIQIKPSKVHDGLQILIDGVPAGNWSPQYKTSPIIHIERENTALSLNAFIRNNGLDKLLILSTERGESDYMSPVNDKGLSKVWTNVRCKYLDKDALLTDLQSAIDKHDPSGVVFIRGGADTSKTMQMWDDPEFVANIMAFGVHFYAAIGHSDKHFMIDKYADESFASPGDFGHKLVQVSHLIQTEKFFKNKNEQLNKQCEKLDKSLVNLKKRQMKYIISSIALTALATAVLFTYYIGK